MGETLQRRVLAYIRRHQLVRAGDRVGAAVSAGADSVALLRLLLELRSELGVVLSVVHFNHKIRGAEAEADEAFVRALAERYDLELHCSSGDAPGFARRQQISLETAGRELRYAFFRRLLRERAIDHVATAHTLDDQAETVLLRLVRGAWTKGLAGIYPELRVASRELREHMPVPPSARDNNSGAESIARPLLEIGRPELEDYLRALGQNWREDASNRDLQHLRNRVRHVLLPLLEREFNPAIRDRLAEMAEIARAEERYWRELLKNLTTEDTRDTEVSLRLLQSQVLAVRRRLVRAAAERCGLELDFRQVDDVVALAESGSAARCELQSGWFVERERERIVFRPAMRRKAADYDLVLPVPGEVRICDLGLIIRASVLCLTDVEKSGYNRGELLDVHSLEAGLRVRNWRPGDRFWPAHSKSPKKVKELLQERHVSGFERALWPVVVTGDELVWMRGFGAAEKFGVPADAVNGLVIEVMKP